MVSNFSSLAFESRVADRLRNLKNYGIIMNTLFRKAAERGGVHPVYIDKVSSQFAKEIENAKTVKEINEIMPEILVKYCNLVRKNSTKGYSPAVKKAIIKIESDLTADLSLNEMAKLCNVSSGYLSALFKKETGKTLTDFVNDKRVSFAKHLLKTTNLQVQTIAQHCGILDFHYFCRMFKKSVGLTPTQYREKYLFS
jgi:YesN/AraC family two-component response regulator